ncbi:MAG TPA: peptide-methionine (S)-S-oxide reductase MsrA [Longilinea sp.]|nr:peptide-methionine (S)-S-oxide reductase MsrA [Longilinea sp.]
MNKAETAYFGTGCFWCSEAIFRRLKGVLSVTPGYAGGTTPHPSYEQVCTSMTGHAETARIEFDPDVIPYEDLLEVFWNVHDPTTLNRQGNDVGTQYRSIILYVSEEQRKAAEQSLKDQTASHTHTDPIVTQIEPLGEFYPAETYHKDYYEHHGNQPYCRLIISPKLNHLREKYEVKMKAEYL